MPAMKLCAVRFCRKVSGDGVLVALGLQRGSEREAFSGEWRWRHPSFRLVSNATGIGLWINAFRARGCWAAVQFVANTAIRERSSSAGDLPRTALQQG
jgi:hypothetical protein